MTTWGQIFRHYLSKGYCHGGSAFMADYNSPIPNKETFRVSGEKL